MTAPTASAVRGNLPRVTLIGDSVSSAIPGDSVALATLEQGVDLQLQIAPCRTVAGVSCPYGGSPPPTVADVVRQLGQQLGSTVIVVAGYNDPEDQFTARLGEALQALHDAGVTHILWPTLHVIPQDVQYAEMNDTLHAAAAVDPGLTVVDWDAAAHGHDNWFQPDGTHLFASGAEALATLLHSELVNLGIAPRPLSVMTAKLDPARRNWRYAVTLTATGGVAPYRWSCRPALPRGLHLLAGGRLVGVATGRPQSAPINFTVTDATGTTGVVRLVLRVR
jgi:hypothetical protein